MKLLTEQEKTLIGYYALHHNKVLLFQVGKKDVTEETKSKARFVLFYTSINPQELLVRPQIVDCLFDSVIKITKETQKLEMFHFYRKDKLKVESLSDFLKKLNDKKLKERFEESLKQLEECYICMDEKAEHYLKCGHKMCETCIKKLEKSNCPFCREKFTEYLSKKEEKVEIKVKKAKKDAWNYVESTEIEKFLENRLKTIFSSTSQITPKNQEEFEMIFEYNPTLVMKIFQDCKIPSEETRAIILGKFCQKCFQPTKDFQENENSDAFKSFGKKFINNPNRLLRFLAYLHSSTPKVDGAILVKFRKGFRSWIISIIDSWKIDSTTCEQLKQHQEIWKFLFGYLHIGTYKKFKTAQEIAKCCRSNQYPMKSTLGELEDNFQKKKGLEILSIFKKNPGLFFRNANRFCNTFPDVDKDIFISIIEKILPTMRAEQLVELTNVLGYDSSNFKEKSFVTKFGTMKWIDKQAPKKTKLHSILIKQVEIALMKVLDKNKLKNVDVCVIDESMDNYRIKKGPAQKPAKFCTKAPSTRGDTVDFSSFSEDTEFVLYNSWKHSSSIFLDLTCFGIDSNFKAQNIHQTTSDYSHTQGFNGCVVHSGDVYENGALLTSQYCKFNFKKLTTTMPNVSYLVLANLSYSGVSFDDMEESSVGIGYLNDKQGSGPYKSHVIDACNLRGNAKLNLGGVLDIKNKKFTFMNINVKNTKKGVITVSRSHGLLSDVVKHFCEWIQTPSSPISWLNVAKLSVACYEKVIIKKSETEFLFFQKNKNESSIEFLRRIESKKNDSMPEEYSIQLKGNLMKEEENMKEEEDMKEVDSPIWLYYGNNDFNVVEIPQNSVIVTSEKLSNADSSIIHCDDPFKIFYLKQ
eukprot:gene11251-4070_t